MGAVDIGVGHDNDAAVAQLLNVESAFVRLTIFFSVFLRLADAGADGGDHRLDFGILERLIEARFFDVDEFAADGEDGLVTPIASLFRGASGGVALDNVELGEIRVALRTIG